MKIMSFLLLITSQIYGINFGIEYSKIPFQNIKNSPISQLTENSTDYIVSLNYGKEVIIKKTYINFTKDSYTNKNEFSSKLYEYYAVLLGKGIKIAEVKLCEYNYTFKFIPLIGISFKTVEYYKLYKYNTEFECSYSGIQTKKEYYFSPVYGVTLPLAGFQVSLIGIPKEKIIFSLGLGF